MRNSLLIELDVIAEIKDCIKFIQFSPMGDNSSYSSKPKLRRCNVFQKEFDRVTVNLAVFENLKKLTLRNIFV